MAKVSLVIIAQNEERTIGAVLKAALPLASEAIVVDSGSTDRTREIASELGARVVHQDWLGYAAQKNFALGLASGDWLLSLDADEILTPQLVNEIESTVNGPRASEFAGFKIPRILHIGDRPVMHGGFYPDAQLRLFRPGSGQFRERLVHEAVFVDGKVGRLHEPMLHYAYKDVAGFEAAMEKYARLSAQETFTRSFKPWKAGYANEMLHPLWTFFYRFVVRGGFLDGALGLELTSLYSDYVRKKIRYLREIKTATPAPGIKPDAQAEPFEPHA